MIEPPILTRPSEVRALLAQLDFHPSRILGQNFLIDRNILGILLAAAELQPTDRVVEVGPGLGVLTDELLMRASAVSAVEKDHRLAAYLRTRFAEEPRLVLHEGDILEADLPALFAAPGHKLVANLPYAIAARLLVELGALPHPPELIVVTIQREVAERLVARPGGKDYGLLAILLQRHYEIAVVKNISPSCFWPPPEVQSAIVKLTRRAAPLGGAANEQALRELLRHAFSQRRKTLARSLRGVVVDPLPALAQVGIAPTARAEEIPPDRWPPLLRALR
ncbi:MAG TPA: 16S rRNA (adenine(1518)-N(6)/adenine(1519)-N(6))-dimethyltransferase RsmA [Kiritimatiellia bacterium]|jgi:16S rRNA (adenine1518-N6/adenine1519-N6)-dimethyltransferase|nr:ribosomal RNA small subunit methyltransferase A [Kiritimatiellia bacterium]OQC57204.1 MAG: Ribosomal RNA small subunit methyltransferase A [Verrucomicrobia bacterium ADurb.Bin018]MBP9572591.1 ribosomal RNA small subunit methyltransferase A [Kiritimatiellia bacterium]HOE00887.1 16S rRNA (adenine(1518)-N(6)/adenine(1519)-N(6))-dimethyltransferase RsmA [Kiritimatiellia bacterium]HOE36242.1 16S rRNA (adenine(1518)-N(6)/adenine(1519)-N(6))-dimethyltransferase RsmA [Kiritimatiellia bacterium]